MPATTIEARTERRTNIADWITAVFGIFWSVWWGFLINKIFEEHSSPFRLFEVPYLFFSALIVCAFSIIYVRWLWNIQRVAYERFLISLLVRSSVPLFFAILIFLANVGIAGILFSVPVSLILYGVVLTLVWPFVVLATLWGG